MKKFDASYIYVSIKYGPEDEEGYRTVNFTFTNKSKHPVTALSLKCIKWEGPRCRGERNIGIDQDSLAAGESAETSIEAPARLKYKIEYIGGSVDGKSFFGSPTQTGCFVATAAFRDEDHLTVQILRDYRDDVLMHSRPGQSFVDWYYQNGPKAAAFVERHPGFQAAARMLLTPAAHALRAVYGLKRDAAPKHDM